MNSIFVTLKKELRSMFRDKKTTMMMFVYPLLIPAMILLYAVIYEDTSGEEPITVGVNFELSEVEESIYDEMNVDVIYKESIDELEEIYDKNEISGYVEYNSSDNIYYIYTDPSSTNGMIASSVIESCLESYSTVLTNNYLVEQGIDLEVAYNNFGIEYKDLSESNYMLQMIFTISILYLVMSICLAATNMSTSATALEKENGTLETILTFPINKTSLIIGKYVASVVLGFLTSLIGLILMYGSIIICKNNYSVFENYNVDLGFGTIFGSVVVLLSASLFISGVALLLTSSAKSFKEAQGSAGALSMITLVPMFVSLMEIEINRYFYLIPICNFEQVLTDLFSCNLDIINLLITFGATIIYIVVIIFMIIKTYNSEKILFKD